MLLCSPTNSANLNGVALTFKWFPDHRAMNSTSASMFGSSSRFSHYRHCKNKSVHQRPEFFLHLRLLTTAGLTAELQQPWLIKQGFNLASSSRFTDAYHPIDLWLIHYCHFHYPAGWISPDTTTRAQRHILAVARLTVYKYSVRFRWQTVTSTKCWWLRCVEVDLPLSVVSDVTEEGFFLGGG